MGTGGKVLRYPTIVHPQENPTRGMWQAARGSVLGMLYNPQIFGKFLKSPFYNNVPELLIPRKKHVNPDDDPLSTNVRDRLNFFLKILLDYK